MGSLGSRYTSSDFTTNQVVLHSFLFQPQLQGIIILHYTSCRNNLIKITATIKYHLDNFCALLCSLTTFSVQYMGRIRQALCADMQSLKLQIHTNALQSKHRLDCHSYQMCSILLICLVFDMNCWGRRNHGGGMRGSEQSLLLAACERSCNMNTERKALFKFERLSCSLYLCPSRFLHPSLSTLHLTCMWAKHTGGGRKTIMLCSHKSTGHNSQAIHY